MRVAADNSGLAKLALKPSADTFGWSVISYSKNIAV